MKKNAKFKILTVLTVTALTVLACGMLSAPVPTPAFPTLAPTDTPAIVPTATTMPPTPEPPTAVPPTVIPPTSVPAPTSIPGAVRIDFATGATAGVVTGELQPGEVQNFLVGASAGQPLMVSTGSYNNDVTFSVTGAKNGQILLDASQKLASWQTMLTETQDYLIRVYAGASAENFTLNVITPARITFDPGAVSATEIGDHPRRVGCFLYFAGQHKPTNGHHAGCPEYERFVERLRLPGRSAILTLGDWFPDIQHEVACYAGLCDPGGAQRRASSQLFIEYHREIVFREVILIHS